MKTKALLIGIIVIGLMIASFIVGRKSVDVPKITTDIKWDTVFVEKPVPHIVERVRKVSVPIYVPTPADTVVENKENARADSTLVEVPVEVERREYNDSLYRAVVSGAVVGDIHPTLESMEIYSRNTTSIVHIKPPLFTPYISACGGKGIFGVGGGISIKNKVDLGAKYLRVNNRDAWILEANLRFNKRK